MNTYLKTLRKSFLSNHEKMLTWIDEKENHELIPFYSSVDIRISDFKCSVIDTNIFPAGFNNICDQNMPTASQRLKDVIFQKRKAVKNILIVTEEHTRNKWYLENIYTLKRLLENAGFNVNLGTNIENSSGNSKKETKLTLESATGKKLEIECLNEYLSFKKPVDFIILNNDLSNGVPEALVNSSIPIYPSIEAGWA